MFILKKNNNPTPPNPFFANPAEPLLPGARHCGVSIVVPLHVSPRCREMRPPRRWSHSNARASAGRGRAPGSPAIARVGCSCLWVSAGGVDGELSCRQQGFGSGMRRSWGLMQALGGSVWIFPLSVLLFVHWLTPSLCWHVLNLS